MYARGCGLIVIVAWLISGASAATLNSSLTKEGKVVISLSGPISQGDAEKFKELTTSANSAGRLVSGIRLNSPGGNLLEAVKLADLVRFAKIATVVAKHKQCASTCFLVFAAGYEKYANYTAEIGIHGASDKFGQETVESEAATTSMARIVKQLGVPESIIGKMVTTPPDKMVWLSASELRTMGTTMVGMPVQTPPSGSGQSELLPQLAPEAEAKGVPSSSWGELVKKAIAVSSAQNNGKPNFVRTCEPEVKVCVTGIYIKGKGGKDTLLKQTEDISGRTISREFCEFNAFGDIRNCLNWDTNEKHQDMKDAHGNWVKVGQ